MTLATGSRNERFKQGKALRRETPREAHADLKGSLSRNAVAILAESDRDRVPELVPERYARMSLNPFAFLRGAAAVMATDLAAQPTAGIPVQAGGDSHLMNFGAFVTPENNILFDVNDFDETLPGVDFTVDLKRLAASVAVAALGSGASKRQARALAAATVKAYRLHMAALARLSPLEIWHSRIDLEQEIDRIGNGGLRRKLAGVIAKARGEGLSNDDNFPHLVSGDDPKIVDRPPTIFHLDPKADARHKLGVERCPCRVSQRPQSGSTAAARPLHDEGYRIQGGRRRLRRDILLRRPVSDRRQRTVVPPDQAGAAFRAGASRRQPRIQGAHKAAASYRASR